jgi:hypothetical protein
MATRNEKAKHLDTLSQNNLVKLPLFSKIRRGTVIDPRIIQRERPEPFI